MTTSDLPIQFSDVEKQELAEYRPINSCSLIALIVGLFSGLALTHLVLCVIPLSGVFLAVQALRQLAHVENRQSGRKFAVIGLGLSLFFGSWALARDLSRESRLYEQARVFADQWFELLRDGKYYEVHQLTLMEAGRVAAGTSLEEHYSDESESDDEKKPSHPSHGDPAMMEMTVHPHVELDNFFHQAMPARLRALGSKARYAFRENRSVVNLDSSMVEVQLLYTVTDSGSGNQVKSFPVLISLVRHVQPELAADWRVLRVADPYAK